LKRMNLKWMDLPLKTQVSSPARARAACPGSALRGRTPYFLESKSIEKIRCEVSPLKTTSCRKINCFWCSKTKVMFAWIIPTVLSSKTDYNKT
jgi:hypothetical protein